MIIKGEEIQLKLVRKTDYDPVRDYVPAFYFDICLHSGEKIGQIDLRNGYSQKLYYGGHIGYSIEEAHRGHHYAAKACRLLFSLARELGLEYVYITCNPDNYASRKTCEYAGGKLLEIVDLPEDNDMYLEADRQKCIYYFDLKNLGQE